MDLTPNNSKIVLNAQVISEFEFPGEHSFNLDEYLGQPGKEHYRLLAYLSTFFHGQTIMDIGTHYGCSAAALCFNKENVVHTFDIDKKNIQVTKPNCLFHISNLWEAQTRDKLKDLVLTSPLIFLDIDPHQGLMEFEFYEWLVRENYQGTLIF